MLLSCRRHGATLTLTTSPIAVQVRGKKTITSVKLSDLPQGIINADPLPLEPQQNGPAYPTVLLQARRNMDKFDNCVLLTRVGGFYELYFEHAEEFGPLLNLKVATKKTNAGPVSMVRFSRAGCYHMLTLLVRIPLLPAGSLSQGLGSGSQPICSHSGRVSK